ncbi:MAG: TetR family transcriptional regulator, partial [Microthrixaceae bacterium]
MSTRDRIVTATNELFRTRGYHDTSLSAITAAATAPTGSIYYFFPGGKSSVAAAALRESGAAYEELFKLVAEAAPGPAAAVRAFFDGAA